LSAGQIIRFGVYWVDLDPPGRGHEQQKRRPCVVVSPDAMHQSQMAVVCPMTTQLRPWPFRLRTTCNGNANDIMVDQIRAVSLSRFNAFIEILGMNDIQRLQDLIALMYTT
jgi:mRNA interferase MazF